jgi:hypothetical protein
MVSIDDLVEFAQSQFEDADVGGECDDHGERNLVKMGSEQVCPDCLSEYLHGVLMELDGRFNILASAEEPDG